jgi:phage-related protein
VLREARGNGEEPLESPRKPVVWMGRSRDDLRAFPKAVRIVMAYALLEAQDGRKHPDAKPLRGFEGAGVLEIVDDDDGDTYRGVYTVRFGEAVYVLHVFQKKSTRGIATPKRELDTIRRRLAEAQARHERWAREQAKGQRP